jgi:hypothetical protein
MQNKPDLVLDEPIATGWLRTTLFGDLEAAKGYIGTARAMLGRMKTHYGVNERTANGEAGGFYMERRVLADGTRIEVITNDGHDTLRISVPPTAESVTTAPQPSEALESPETPEQPSDTPSEPVLEPRRKRALIKQKLDYPDTLVCGVCANGADHLHPVAWGFIHDNQPLELGFLPDCVTGEALAISIDGTTIVGYSQGPSGTFAFRWTEDDGMQALGTIGSGHYAIATDVSADGAAICGICRNDDDSYAVWRWDAAPDDGPGDVTLMSDLGLGAMGIGIPPRPSRANKLRFDCAPSISPDGRLMCGVMRELTPMPSYVGVAWDADGALQRIPVPGTTTEPYGVTSGGTVHPAQDGLYGPGEDGDQSLPVDINDAGLVAGYSMHLSMVSTVYHIDNSDGVSPPDQYPLVADPLSPNTAFLWQMPLPEVDNPGKYAFYNDGDLVAIDGDGVTLAGNSIASPLNTVITVDVFQHPPEFGIPDTTVTTTSQAFNAPEPAGWYLIKDKPVQSLGPFTSTYAMSDDGEIVVGAAQTDADSSFGLPALWAVGATVSPPTLLDLIDGTTTGWASGVASLTYELELPDLEVEVDP